MTERFQMMGRSERILLYWFLFFLGFVYFGFGASEPIKLVWPTPNQAYIQGKALETYVQPTASGVKTSGLFGLVRNNGWKFHEGLDLKALLRDRRGDPTDPIFAIMDGVVVHVNRVAGNSNYGCYVVIEHRQLDVPIYSLYAHMASIRDAVKPGVRVKAGAALGVMGHSASGYSIPKSRSHLHLEIGFRLSNDFESWYQRQHFKTPNQHGNYNGMNLVGFNPKGFYDCYRGKPFSRITEYLETVPIAYELLIYSNKRPEFIRRFPQLLIKGFRGVTPPDAWRVGFSWYGLPLAWEPIYFGDESLKKKRGTIRILHYDKSLLESAHRRRTLRRKGNNVTLGREGSKIIQLLFGFH